MTDYDPLTGDGYTQGLAMGAWSGSMGRSAPDWQLRGKPGNWRWEYFKFQPYTGRVTVETDGFHWQTISYDNPDEILHQGITTSLYVAYQSVVQNRGDIEPPAR